MFHRGLLRQPDYTGERKVHGGPHHLYFPGRSEEVNSEQLKIAIARINNKIHGSAEICNLSSSL